MMKTTINATDLELINIAASDRTRHNLTFVHVTPAFSEATDGKILCRVNRPGAVNESAAGCFLTKENVKTLSPMARRGQSITVENATPDPGSEIETETVFSGFEGATTLKTEGVTYVDTARVMPHTAPGTLTPGTVQVGIDLALLTRLAKVYKKAGETVVKLTIKTEDRHAPIHVTGVGDAENVQAVVMPCVLKD
jgi:hypothetical protein